MAEINVGYMNFCECVNKEINALNPYREGKDIPLAEFDKRAQSLNDLLDNVRAKFLMRELKKLEETSND